MFKCLICGFKTKHSKVMVKHLMKFHRFKMEHVREKWNSVVAEEKKIILRDEIDFILSGVKKL